MDHEEKQQGITRWRVLLAGIILQTAIGGIYAWSTFVPALVEQHGLTRSETGLLFGVQIAIFTVVTIPAGALLQKRGPRLTAGIGALLFSAGYLGASFSGGSFPLLLLFLGLITGTGIGMVYVCPLTTGMLWFPKNRGMVTGAAVAGFGIGAIILSAVAEYFMVVQGFSVHALFQITAICFGGIAFLAALLLATPKHRTTNTHAVSPPSAKAAQRSSRFRLIRFSMFAGTFAGLLISGNLKPFILSIGGSEAQAVLSISLFAVGNTLGRLTWGAVHDRLKQYRTTLLSLGTLAMALFAMVGAGIFAPAVVQLPLILLVGFGFGACFVVYASAIVESFGMELLPRLYPISFMGYGFAALIAPAIGGFSYDTSGSYQYALVLSGIIVLIATVATISFDKSGQRNEERYAQ